MLQTSNFSIVHKLPHYMDIAYQDFDDLCFRSSQTILLKQHEKFGGSMTQQVFLKGQTL